MVTCPLWTKMLSNSFGAAFPSWISSFSSLLSDLKLVCPQCINMYIKPSMLSDKIPTSKLLIMNLSFTSSSLPSINLSDLWSKAMYGRTILRRFPFDGSEKTDGGNLVCSSISSQWYWHSRDQNRRKARQKSPIWVCAKRKPRTVLSAPFLWKVPVFFLVPPTLNLNFRTSIPVVFGFGFGKSFHLGKTLALFAHFVVYTTRVLRANNQYIARVQDLIFHRQKWFRHCRASWFGWWSG